MQDLSDFRLPLGFRGRSAVVVQVWWAVQATLFAWSPQFLYPLRVWLLRIFGARIGCDVLIRPTARITYPWKVSIGDHSWIGDDVVLYSLGDITVGRNSVISQRSYVCAADHDPQDLSFAIRSRPISIGDGVWIATDVFIGPGVNVGDNTVVGARSSVFSSLPSNSICNGSPARVRRQRYISTLIC
jgi:putative colanic acid biosynthesis acetyltransferase WcaF